MKNWKKYNGDNKSCLEFEHMVQYPAFALNIDTQEKEYIIVINRGNLLHIAHSGTYQLVIGNYEVLYYFDVEPNNFEKVLRKEKIAKILEN